MHNHTLVKPETFFAQSVSCSVFLTKRVDLAVTAAGNKLRGTADPITILLQSLDRRMVHLY